MCGRVRLSSDVSKSTLVFSIRPERPTPNIAPSWNRAPTDLLLVVPLRCEARRARLIFSRIHPLREEIWAVGGIGEELARTQSGAVSGEPSKATDDRPDNGEAAKRYHADNQQFDP